MAYMPPNFNLFADLWVCDGAQRPADGVADIEDVPCQKYVASRAAWPVTPPWVAGYFLAYHPPVQLRFPRAAPFDLEWSMWKVSCVEVPQGSGQYYRVVWGDVQHQGFTNEYALLVAVQCNADLLVVPPPVSGQYFGIGEDACGNEVPADEPIEVITPGPGQPPGPPPSAFLDNFLDQPLTYVYDHMPDQGGGLWTNGFGLIQITADGVGLRAGASNNGPCMCSSYYNGPEDGTTNLITKLPASLGTAVQWGITLRNLGPNTWIGLIVAYTGSGGLYAMYWVKNTAGTLTTVGSASSTFTLAASTQYELITIQTGDQLDGQLNGPSGTIAFASSVTTSDFRPNASIGLQNYVSAANPPVTFLSLSKVHP